MTEHPICTMTRNEEPALNAGNDDRTFHFCRKHRRKKFLFAPAREGRRGNGAPSGTRPLFARVPACRGINAKQRSGAPQPELVRWDPKLFLCLALGAIGGIAAGNLQRYHPQTQTSP